MVQHSVNDVGDGHALKTLEKWLSLFQKKEQQSFTSCSIAVVRGGGVEVSASILIFYIDILSLKPRVKQVKCMEQERQRSNSHKGIL